MNLNGYYRTLISAQSEAYDWLRFYDDGVVVLARTGGRLETLAAWFGRDDGEFADGQGRFTKSGSQLSFSIADAYTTIQYEGTITGDLLSLNSRWNTQSASRVFTFFAPPMTRTALFQITVPVPKDEPKLPIPILPPVPLAWWHFAESKGWRCRRCGKIPFLEERECWFDTSCCTECAIEDGR